MIYSNKVKVKPKRREVRKSVRARGHGRHHKNKALQ